MRATRVPLWAPLLAVAACLAFIAAVASPIRNNPGGRPPPEPSPSHPIAFYDEREFGAALNQTQSAPVQTMPGAHVVIVPHHWLPGYLITEGFRDLAATRRISRVILVGPDHVNAGIAPATTSTLAWNTPFGQLAPASDAIAGLISGGLVEADPETLAHEHSIAGIVHAVAYYMPDATIVPIALRHDMTPDQVSALASAVDSLVDDETAVVIAEDFSHYLSAPEAEANDKQTLAALSAMDSSQVALWGNEHLDSPQSVELAIDLARLLGDDTFVLRQNTNSGILSGTLTPPVTSYIAGYFTAR